MVLTAFVKLEKLTKRLEMIFIVYVSTYPLLLL